MSWTFTTPKSGYLEPQEQRQVERLQARIVISDPANGVPGATEAAAANFLSRLLAMDDTTYYDLPAWRMLYRDGLARLEQAAQAKFGTGLVDLDDTQCDKLLADLEGSTCTDLPEDFDQTGFFTTLWRHTLQGCFADSRWGGNANNVMWRWYGYLQDVRA